MQLNCTNTQLLSIKNGDAGTLYTLKIMRNLVREFKKNLVIRNLACQLVKNVAEKNWVEEARAIHEFVKKKIRYVKDINGVETLHTPLKLLDVRQGDCDDKATLAATLLESIGHPTRFVAVGFGGYGFSHVYLETKIGKNWLALETTEPWPIGRAVKNATRKIEIYN